MNLSEKTLIFVYGTLKRSQPNHALLEGDRDKIEFLSEATTVEKWPLVIATERNVPYLLYKRDHGKNVKGELYKVDKETLEILDDFEGVKKGVYSCFLISVKTIPDETIQTARTYMLDNFKTSMLTPETILFENYSSINEFFRPYSRTNFANNFDDYLKQIKEKL